MGICIDRPKDLKAAKIHSRIPELSLNRPLRTIIVNEGQLAISSKSNRYVTMGISECTVVLFQNETENVFGLFHIYPGQELTQDQEAAVKTFRNGNAIIVEGSQSTSKKRIINQTLIDNSIVAKVRCVNTVDTSGSSEPFHLVFRPLQNELITARISHRDTQIFPAFK